MKNGNIWKLGMISMFQRMINQNTSYNFQFTAKEQILFHKNRRNNILVLAELLDYLMVTNN